MNIRDLLSIFASGPTAYEASNHGSEIFVANDENYFYRLNCHRRRGVHLRIKCRKSKETFSAQMLIHNSVNQITDAILNIHWKLDDAADQCASEVDLKEDLGEISRNLAYEENFHPGHTYTRIEIEALALLKLLSGHNSIWHLRFDGPVEIRCSCPRCSYRPIWVGEKLPYPLDQVRSTVSYPELKATKNTFRPDNVWTVLGKCQNDIFVETVNVMARLRALGVTDLSELEALGRHLSSI